MKGVEGRGVGPSSVVDAGSKTAQHEVQVDVDVGAVLGGPGGAEVSELVCPLVGDEAHVGRDPGDDDRNGEVPNHLLDLLGESGVSV